MGIMRLIAPPLSWRRYQVTVTGLPRSDHKNKVWELTMRKVISSMIALSLLAGIATSVAAQTKQDEDRGNYFNQQKHNLP